MAESPPYAWTGQDGVRHVVTEVTDRHLLYYFRLLQERGQRLLGHSMDHPLRRQVATAILLVYNEIEKRGLENDILPVRSEQERQEAEARRQAWAQQRDQLERVPDPRPVMPPRPPTVDIPMPSRLTRAQRERAKLENAQKEAHRTYKANLDLLRPAPPPGKRKIVIKKPEKDN